MLKKLHTLSNCTFYYHTLMASVLMMFAGSVHGQETPDILDFGNGQIIWTNADPSLHYTIEWKALMTDSNWQGSYRSLQDLQSSSSTVTTDVPMFLRVVGYSNAVHTTTLSPNTSEVLSGYLFGTNLTQVEVDLVASNIRAGVVLFGITGTLDTGSSSPLVTIEMVTVGDAGNPDDSASNGLLNGGDTTSGAVTNSYKIGKYEVSNSEYVTFLNAVDPNGANGLDLYNSSMSSDTHGGITNNAGAAVGAKYEVKPGFANKPVVYVSFYDAMRFCNWLHNGAATGGDTENGAYTLLGGTAVPTNGTNVLHNGGASFWVPTEDEWYKAAFYQPQGDGGDPTGYWFYPTGANSAPNASSPPGTAPAANYNNVVGSVTPVGAYTNTVGYYGTFDMAGNVEEWTERVYISSVPRRVVRSGQWKQSIFAARRLESGSPLFPSPTDELNIRGFRIAGP